MKITFMGAAQTVTGSCYILENGRNRFSIDCGMHQGNAEIEKRNLNMAPYRPSELDFVLVTHAHIDHTGLLPRLVAKGFKGPIYATPPTLDLMRIMLLDSAHIQEMEAEWRTRKRQRHGQAAELALYTTADAEACLNLFKPVEYGKPFEPGEGVRVVYRDAGHILGSALIELEYEENGKSTKLVFSGDLGRPHQLLVEDPSLVETTDYLFLESTYGDRNHKDDSNSLDELAEAVAYAHRNGEKVIIPAFAVERSQQIIYALSLLREQGRLPADMPVYLDSPLAIQATEVFRRHPEYFDEETRERIAAGRHPLDLPNLRFSQTRDDSQAINNTPGPAVVISASGMANAGRIKHHLRHNLWRKGASIVFVGFQAEGTPGRKIVNGARKILLFGEEVAVAARVFTINGFSGHAGQSELMDWLKSFKDHNQLRVILTHGEAKSQERLAALIRETLHLEPHIPAYREELTLEPGQAMQPVVDADKAAPRIDWEFLLQDSERLYAEFRKRVEQVQTRTWTDQTELRDRVLDVNRRMVELISEL
ncbi:MAG TPA: MBL fold hydrolase [Desulfovibrio sp.]|nr:MBL fold hydrolase [Desulfovibrio sp.]